MNTVSSTRISLSRGPVIVALAALCWGISAGISGILIDEGWDPFVVSFYRGAIGLVFVSLWLALRPGGNGLGSYRTWLWSIVAGLGVAGNFAFFFISIAESGVAVAATLMYCAPVFVLLASFALQLERPTAFKWLAISTTLVGILMLTRIYRIEASEVTPLGAATGLLAGMCYALFVFGFKFAATHASPQAILVITFATLVLLLVWPGDSHQTISALSTPSWPLFILLGVLGGGVSFILYVVGLRQVAPGVASIMAMVEPVTASLFGVFVLQEDLNPTQLTGAGLILLTVTLLGVKSGHTKASPRSGRC